MQILELQSEPLFWEELKLIYLTSDGLTGTSIEETSVSRSAEWDILAEKFFPFESVAVDDSYDILEKYILSSIVPEWKTDNNCPSKSDGSEIPKHTVIYSGEFSALLGNLVWRDCLSTHHIPKVSFGHYGSGIDIHMFRDSHCDFRGIRLEDKSIEVNIMLDGKFAHTFVRCGNHRC